MTPSRIALGFVKIFLMIVVTFMIVVQIPEFRYDLTSGEPVPITSPDQLSVETYGAPTFAVVHGTPDLDRAAAFSKHGVPFSYFLLEEYGPKLVVRAPEEVTEDWAKLDRHVGRLRTYSRMPFRRSIRAGFQSLFEVTIPEDALFLARDDVPHLSGWSLGGMIFAVTLWVVLFYFFVIWRRPGKKSQ